jgi:hypothetical protein
MYKIVGQIIIALATSIVAELILDHYFRKPKAQLRLHPKSKKSGDINTFI